MTTEQSDRITKMVAEMPVEELANTLSYFISRLLNHRLNKNEAPYCDAEKLGFMTDMMWQSSQSDEFSLLEGELDIEEGELLHAALTAGRS